MEIVMAKKPILREAVLKQTISYKKRLETVVILAGFVFWYDLANQAGRFGDDSVQLEGDEFDLICEEHKLAC